jgi:16S rRNA (uracil1498-N3)-methyltransferase
MPHFFVSPSAVRDGRFALGPEESRHVAVVLRKKPGDEVSLFDGEGGVYRAVLESVAVGAVGGRILSRRVEGPEPYRLRLFQGLPKGDKFDWIVQKATELGAAEIVPVVLARSVSRPPADRVAAKQKRWRKIAAAAAEQSGRSRVPEVRTVTPFTEALKMCGAEDLTILPWEGEETVSLRQVLTPPGRARPSVNVFIGPEGGLTPAEVDAARRAGAVSVSLGPAILRTETAGLYVASVIQYEWGRHA